MATNFPTSLDTLTNPTATNPVTSPSHADQHANANDAIEALEAKVGINSSAVTTSLDYKLTNASSSNPGHTHTSTAISDFATAVGAYIPPGMIAPYAGSSAPTNWLLCDGSAVSRTTYSALYNIISTTYGTGDGSTTFNLPNLKGKVPVGRDAAQTEFDTLSETGGAKTHTLAASEIPNPGITVPRAGNNTAGSGTYFVMSTADGGENKATTASITGASGTAHNNLQPYLVINYIIKT